MFKFNVTVKLKNAPPIIIECLQFNDVVFHSDMICVHNLLQKWVFMKSEIEFILIERIAYDE